jgi:hypothetical protein
MTAQALWMNIPLMVLAFALWVGVPLWLVLRHPDRSPRENRSVPAYLRARRAKRPAPIRARAHDGQPGLVAM